MTVNSAIVIERVSPSDAMDLACDVTGTSMQVAAVLVLGADLAADAVRDTLGRRIIAIPRLRQKLVPAPFGGGLPVWIDDAEFDVCAHVLAVACPAPGDEQAMLEVVAIATGRRLPPDRPLWSATIITGLAGGRSAVVVVFHHVLADGIGGLAILAHLVDGLPTEAGTDSFPRPAPGRRELRTDALHRRAAALRGIPARLARLRSAAVELGVGRPSLAPGCSLNQPIGTRRALAVVRTDLAALKAVAHAHHGTVNDVLLTAVAGALGAVLAGRGEIVDRLVVSVPVSDRRGTGPDDLGNHVGVIPVSVPTTGEPTARLDALASRLRRTAAPGSSAALIDPLFRLLAWCGIFGWFINRQRQINTFVSNLRGPQDRLHFLGAPVLELIPVSMIAGNVTVAFGVLSYAGTVIVTVVADPDRCPDYPLVAAALADELRVLGSATATDRQS